MYDAFPMKNHSPKQGNHSNPQSPFSLYFVLFFSIACYQTLSAQDWQQQVNYDIQVSLDDQKHQLHGQLRFTYYNYSPDVLDTIWIHLWPNAYLNNQTAFARQKVDLKQGDFYFGSKETRGGIDSLHFSAGQRPLAWQKSKNHPDIAFLLLDKPLLPKDSILIQTPFRVQIPKITSRLGHDDQSYQISQWYPKPAVYDQDGWHPIPYLDLGEFYSSFGNFRVDITLPKNYVVAATGALKTPSEQAFQKKLALETSNYLANYEYLESDIEAPIPKSDPALKTIRFYAENVHDFAWFADKRYRLLLDTVEISTGNQVETKVFYLPTSVDYWKDAPLFLEKALHFMDSLVGPYPYPQVSVAQGPLGSGGGMEYPMVTVIPDTYTREFLDLTIMHEVCHNWFYGVLAFNERRSPWLDEGLTSYYENRYAQKYGFSNKLLYLPPLLQKHRKVPNWEFGYWYLKQDEADVAPKSATDQISDTQYWWAAYAKPGQLYHYLAAYLGREAFDQYLQSFFRQWAFKHPQPKDLQLHLESESGKNLNWLFEDQIQHRKGVDYKIVSAQSSLSFWSITLENNSTTAPPFQFLVQSPSGESEKVWMEGFIGEKTIKWPKGDYTYFQIDPGHQLVEWNRKNNLIKAKGVFPKLKPVKAHLLPNAYDENYTNFNWTPTVGWNNYDRFMAGLMVHNIGFPARKLQYAFNPMWSTKAGQLVGLGGVERRWFLNENGQQEIKANLSYRSFHFAENETFDYFLNFRRIVPQINWTFKRGLHDKHQIQWRSIHLRKESPVFSNDGQFEEKNTAANWIHELSYQYLSNRLINPYGIKLALEQQRYDIFNRSENYLKASFDLKWDWTYAMRKALHTRIFLGMMLHNTASDARAIFPGAFSLIGRSSNDYRFDQFFFGRTEQEGFAIQQLSKQDGGLKTPISSSYDLGISNQMIFSINLACDLPQQIPIQPYFDIGYFKNNFPTTDGPTFEDQLLWNGGFALVLWPDILEIYFPLIQSENISDIFRAEGNYWNRIGFTVDLTGLKPFGKIDLLE